MVECVYTCTYREKVTVEAKLKWFYEFSCFLIYRNFLIIDLRTNFIICSTISFVRLDCSLL